MQGAGTPCDVVCSEKMVWMAESLERCYISTDINCETHLKSYTQSGCLKNPTHAACLSDPHIH